MVQSPLSYNPSQSVHPGESLRDELESLGISQVELAQRTGLSEKHISQIINGESPITSDTAIMLERAIRVPADFWTNLQKNYELNTARLEAETRIDREIPQAKQFNCYQELVDLGYVKKTRDWGEKTENLLSFFGVNSLSYVTETEKIAFRQGRGKIDKHSLAAWLRVGEIESQNCGTSEYDPSRLRGEIIPRLRELTKCPTGFGEDVIQACASVGIAIVYTPYFKRTRVNGSARRIGEKALIQLNTKGSYNDIFWFTLFHEIGHILLHGAKDEFVDYDGLKQDTKEKEADNFAAKTLIPEIEYQKFLQTKSFTKARVLAFSKEIGVDSSIVLGRLAHENPGMWNRIADRKKLHITHSSK